MTKQKIQKYFLIFEIIIVSLQSRIRGLKNPTAKTNKEKIIVKMYKYEPLILVCLLTNNK